MEFLRTNAVQLAIIAVVIVILLSLLIEKDPAGGWRISKKFTLLKEFWTFIKERKIWWMTPIIVILALLGVFIVLTEKSVVLPFIYAVF